MPTSTPIVVVFPLVAGICRSTSTVKETNQRSAVREMVADRTRAVPCSRRRASLRVDSWVLRTPMRGSWTCLRSASTLIADRAGGETAGIPTTALLLELRESDRRLLRPPLLESLQFLNALA